MVHGVRVSSSEIGLVWWSTLAIQVFRVQYIVCVACWLKQLQNDVAITS